MGFISFKQIETAVYIFSQPRVLPEKSSVNCDVLPKVVPGLKSMLLIPVSLLSKSTNPSISASPFSIEKVLNSFLAINAFSL